MGGFTIKQQGHNQPSTRGTYILEYSGGYFFIEISWGYNEIYSQQISSVHDALQSNMATWKSPLENGGYWWENHRTIAAGCSSKSCSWLPKFASMQDFSSQFERKEYVVVFTKNKYGFLPFTQPINYGIFTYIHQQQLIHFGPSIPRLGWPDIRPAICYAA